MDYLTDWLTVGLKDSQMGGLDDYTSMTNLQANIKKKTRSYITTHRCVIDTK